MFILIAVLLFLFVVIGLVFTCGNWWNSPFNVNAFRTSLISVMAIIAIICTCFQATHEVPTRKDYIKSNYYNDFGYNIRFSKVRFIEVEYKRYEGKLYKRVATAEITVKDLRTGKVLMVLKK